VRATPRTHRHISRKSAHNAAHATGAQRRLPMRRAILAAAFLALASPAFAQQTEMDRAESELRTQMAPAGVAVERVSRDEVRLTMPNDITFDFDSSDVKREFMPRIRSLANTLNSYPSMSIEIIGHADARGSDAYNQALSERRASAVGMRLVNFGVEFDRITPTGRGEWSPVATNETDWGRAQNRRVEVRILQDNKK